MKPSEKQGLYHEKHISQRSRSFRVKTGLPAFHGYLKFKRIWTNVVVGTIKEENLKSETFFLSCFELATLKKILEDFDSRLLTWKNTEDLGKEKKI